MKMADELVFFPLCRRTPMRERSAAVGEGDGDRSHHGQGGRPRIGNRRDDKRQLGALPHIGMSRRIAQFSPIVGRSMIYGRTTPHTLFL